VVIIYTTLMNVKELDNLRRESMCLFQVALRVNNDNFRERH
jgi:hypothetical protein